MPYSAIISFNCVCFGFGLQVFSSRNKLSITFQIIRNKIIPFIKIIQPDVFYIIFLLSFQMNYKYSYLWQKHCI